ncbi:MAG: EscU/YscU/HrcU family type III secretion system export apparatus switch protein [Spirochaetales bacterium]|nr:EscU/YscU/HrcU family type III secretion system export apparatus switch protein [Spirochaetales bacterium]
MDNLEKKKLKSAAALKYFKGLPAPFVISKGKGNLADKIIAIAEQEGIHLVKDIDLNSKLMDLSIGDFIPEEMYEITAEIFSFIWELDKQK